MMPRTQTLLQIIGLIPFAVCAGGLFFAVELTPRWELGLLTYAAVSLSYVAGLATNGATTRWRALPLSVPLAAWLAQLVETQTGLTLLAVIAGIFALAPLRGNRYRLFAAGAAIALIVAAVKVYSYGF